PELDIDDAHVRLVAGQIGNRRGPVEGIVTSPTMLDATLAAGARFRQRIEPTHTAFIQVLLGKVHIGDNSVSEGQLAVLSLGDEVHATASSPARFLLLAGAPIGEPIARSGPFVMNT